MITGYVSYEENGNDDVADGYYYGRLAMIERKASEHGLKSERKRDGADDEVLELEVNLSLRFDESGMVEEEAEGGWNAYEAFLMDLEDSSLGYLLYEVDTEDERRLLESVNVANMSVEKRGEGFAGAESLPAEGE